LPYNLICGSRWIAATAAFAICRAWSGTAYPDTPSGCARPPLAHDCRRRRNRQDAPCRRRCASTTGLQFLPFRRCCTGLDSL